MAKGTDSEEFAFLSGPRTGLKREFAFALKSQSEVSGSLGRTRGRNFGNSPSCDDGDVEDSSRKRFRGSIEEEEPKNDVEKVVVNEEPLDDSIKSPCKEESKSDGAEKNCDELPQSDSSKCSGKEDPKSDCLKSPRKEDPKNDVAESCMEEGTGMKTPIVNVINGNSESMEKTPRRFTRSALKPMEEQKMIGDSSKVNNALPDKPMKRFTRSVLGRNAEQMVMDDNGQVESTSPEKACAQNASVDKPLSFSTPSGSEPLAEQMVVDGNGEVQNLSLEKTPKRFTRSALETKAEEMVKDDSREVHNALPVKTQTLKYYIRAALETKVDQIVKDDRREVHNASLDNTPRRFTRSAMEPAELMVITENSDQHINLSEKPTRRFTRSSLESNTELLVVDDNKDPQNALPKEPASQFTDSDLKPKAETIEMDDNGDLPVEPARRIRFTRSALKPKAEQMEISATGTSGGFSTLSEETCVTEAVAKDNGRTGDTVSSLGAKKKLEMKMSKKIALTKFPTTVQELLGTGMLEGLPVKYVFNGKKNIELRGIIKDCGILCSCLECKECKVVTPDQFKRHAGDIHKDFAEHIFLENGSSLHEVLNACKDTPLDTLETTIQSAIGSSTINDSIICINCKGHLPSHIKRALHLCDSCLEARKAQGIRARTAGTETRLSKAVLPLGSASESVSSQTKSIKGKITRKDLRLHKLVFEEDGLPDGTELAYYAQGKKLLEGYKKGFGIFCRCCNSVLSASTFEAHAGCASRRKPFHQIYTSNGVSLHELSISLSKLRKFSSNDNDDLCGICGDVGDLLLCDGCPRAFHKDCVGESSIPQGKWYCPYCQKIFEQEQLCANNVNAKAAGRISGVDPIEEISKRCIRIVKTIEPEVGGCTLCRSHGFCKVGFGPRTVILCDQCEKEYHVGCLKDHNMADLQELPKGEWFCAPECNRIHSVLQKLIIRGSEELPASISCVIKRKLEGKCLNSDACVHVRWRLLNGKVATPESRSLLSKAVTIFHDRFDPIVDSTTGRDLIPSMVYGRKRGDQEFGGMYCAVLTVNSSVVSAGILRVFGQEIAELPLVATSVDYQGQGYFQSLFCCIERLLGFLNVKSLVLPAAEEAEAIWINKFGFEKISDEQLKNYRKHCQMTTFQGTSMLQKPVPKCRVVDRPKRAGS